VTDEKGEGLMLRDPQGRYEGRRSKTLLKVKTFEDDEATVLGHEEGSGRCQGMCGALRVVNSWGAEFNIGSGMNDEIRRKPPKKGTIITYKYWGTSKNKIPRFPIYVRERPKE
jgi:DNA ligase-1